MNNQLYDVEIVKALEYCAEDTRCVTDRKCPLVADEDCHTTLSRNALELIKRLQDEIENLLCKNAELEVRCEGILKDYYAECQTCDEQKAEIERLTEMLLQERDMAEKLMDKIERLTEEIEQSKSMYDDIRKCNDILLKERAELQKQVDELKEQKAFWEGMHDRVCLKLEEYDDKSEEYENALVMKQCRITELQKQVDELTAFKNEAISMSLYGKGRKDGAEVAVKDTAKEILQKIMNIIKKSDGFLAEEVVRILAKQNGVEVE